MIWAKLSLSGIAPVYICSFYRPLNSDSESILELRKFICSLFDGNSSVPYILMGYFNLLDINWTDAGGEMKSSPIYGNQVNNTFLELLDDFNLEQLVKEPTRYNHILDLIITTQPSISSDIAVTPGMSDHEAVTFKLNIRRKQLIPSKRKIYLYHKANFELIRERIQNFQTSFLQNNSLENTVEENCNQMKSCILTTIEDLVPTKTFRSQHNLPWVNKALRHKIKKRKKMHDHAKASGNQNLWALYKKIRNEVGADLRNAHDAYCHHLFNSTHSSNRKRFWSYIKQLRRDHTDINTLCVNEEILTSPADKAKALNQQFLSVFTHENAHISTLRSNQFPTVQDINFSTHGFECILGKLIPVNLPV